MNLISVYNKQKLVASIKKEFIKNKYKIYNNFIYILDKVHIFYNCDYNKKKSDQRSDGIDKKAFTFETLCDIIINNSKMI